MKSVEFVKMLVLKPFYRYRSLMKLAAVYKRVKIDIGIIFHERKARRVKSVKVEKGKLHKPEKN